MWCRYVYSCVSCSVVMLFTCTLVRSCPERNEGVGCETRSVRTNSKILDEPWQTRNTFGEGDQKEAQSKPGSRPWRMYLQGALRRWLFKYVQVIIMCSCLYNYHVFSLYALQLFISRSWFTLLIAVYFHRLKINHESHEFILESGTITNNTYPLEYQICFSQPRQICWASSLLNVFSLLDVHCQL